MNEEPFEVENSSRSIEAIERAEIDIQIATARRFPRPINTKTISEQIALHATINEETARECYYAIPRAGIVIQGPSVRLSEIIANCFGNLHIAGRTIDHDLVNRSVTAQAVAWDLQNNVRRTAEWAEPITQKASDAAKMTKLVAISKAERNAILKVVPRVIWEPVLQKCIAAAIGDAASLQTRLAKAVTAFSAYGIFVEQILATFGVDAVDKLTQTDLASLLGMYTALKEGTATIDDLFKPLPKSSGAPADPPKRPRGRPRSRPTPIQDENPPDNTPESVDQQQDEASPTRAEELQGERLASDGGSTASNAKEAVISKIREKLEEKSVSEAKLLALLHKMKFSENPAQPLQDFMINDLELVLKRFDQVLLYA